MTSKCGKNKKVAHEAQPSVSLMFLPHFDVLCDLLLNSRTATWNLFIKWNNEVGMSAAQVTCSRFSHDVTAAMLVYTTIAKKVFWYFDSVIV